MGEAGGLARFCYLHLRWMMVAYDEGEPRDDSARCGDSCVRTFISSAQFFV
jgi:hypothetical protein